MHGLYTHYLLSEDVYLAFSYWLEKFSPFYRLFLFVDLVFFRTKKYCIKNHEEIWFKHWKSVVLELKPCISCSDLQYWKSCAKFHSVGYTLQVQQSTVVLFTCLIFFLIKPELKLCIYYFDLHYFNIFESNWKLCYFHLSKLGRGIQM